MEKELKLRAWNEQEGIMLYRDLFDMNWYTTPTNDENGSHCWGPISGGQRRFLKVMLSTGLFDRNKKEIYKGDIIKVWDTNRSCEECEMIEEGTKNSHSNEDDCENYLCTQEVKFNCGWFCEEDTGDCCPPLSEDYLELEIIGNIYQNPELSNPL